MRLKTFERGCWKLTLSRGMTVREIVVDSREAERGETTGGEGGSGGGASNGITVSTTSGTTSGAEGGVRIERLSKREEEEELHGSLEESGSHSSSQLVCSGQFSMERKQSQS